MKITKKKTKTPRESAFRSSQTNGYPIETYPITKAQNRLKEKKTIFCDLNTSTRSVSSKMKKKKFGMPVIIATKPDEFPSVAMPKTLRLHTKYKISLRKNNILSNFISSIEEGTTTSRITIGESIIPTPIKMKKHKKSKNATTKHDKSPQIGVITQKSSAKDGTGSAFVDEANELMDLNESIIINHDKSNLMQNESVASILNDTLQNTEEGPAPHFYSLRSKVICVMEPECKFSFHGKLRINVLYGSVKIYGATLDKFNTSTPVEVYSSRGTNLVSIEATVSEQCTANVSSVWDSLKDDNIDRNISNALQSDINNVQAGWAVIILQNLENSLTTFLGTYSTHRLFPKLEDASNYSWADRKRAEIVLQANIYSENSGRQVINCDNVKEVTETILNKWETNKTLRTILAGGKSVGKSTTIRYLVNRILEKSDAVIVLDLDPGQAEFTPPGCISMNIIKSSLLGPNFTHFKTPYYQQYIGGVDVVHCLTNYIAAINELVQHLNEYSKENQVPIVVNTMGFCKGVGWDIMCYAIKSLQPTDIIQISSKRSKNNFDQSLTHQIINHQSNAWTTWGILSENTANASVEYQLYIIDSRAESRSSLAETWNIEPHQQRDIAMLAYLSEIIKPQEASSSYDDKVQPTINGVIPYEVPFSSVKISLGRPLTSQVLSVMNGNIVALCGSDFEDREPESSGHDSASYPEVLMRAPLATCYGFGIVRGVDMDKKKLYINTPLLMSQLKYVNCLIGCMPVPSGLLQLNRSGVPYAGGERDLPTSRDPRRGYFRMRYRSDT